MPDMVCSAIGINCDFHGVYPPYSHREHEVSLLCGLCTLCGYCFSSLKIPSSGGVEYICVQSVLVTTYFEADLE